MAKYFFDTVEGERTDLDPEGVDLPDEQAAKLMAWTTLSDLLLDIQKIPDGVLAINVGDFERRPFYEVRAVGAPVAAG